MEAIKRIHPVVILVVGWWRDPAWDGVGLGVFPVEWTDASRTTSSPRPGPST